MKSIKVFLYSYKNKNLLDQVKDLMSKESGLMGVVYYVVDQNNVDRDFYFKDLKNVKYNFVQWDDYKSISYYRNSTMFNDDMTNYFLEINPNVCMMRSWDLYLASTLKEKSVISGNGNVRLSIDRHKVRVDKVNNDTVSISNYIDTNLIFTTLPTAMMLSRLNVLKYEGQDLFASAIFLSNGYTIYSLPSNSYSQTEQDNSGTYVPYSKIHGYNKMLRLIKDQNNTVFQEFHGVDLEDLSFMPYEIDDVGYLSYRISLENSEIPRFLSGYNGIQIL
jgi:hypothetical protein